MGPITIDDARRVADATLVAPSLSDGEPITSISTDTRAIGLGSLFVALRGDRFDGHDFLAKAAAAGAVAAIVDHMPAAPPPGMALLLVKDTYQAMGALAKFVRGRLKSKVIAVAGSNGKTGTKLLIDAALSRQLSGSVSPKSYNNRVGVPATIFPADPAADYLVLELGTNHPGEIAPLAEMSLPDIAVITNAGPSTSKAWGASTAFGGRMRRSSTGSRRTGR